MLGYKRSEGVINPVYDENGIAGPGSSKYRDEAYSVLAKITGELRGDAGNSGVDVGTRLSGAQWFATGEAAKKLAVQPGIAGALSGSAEVAREATRQAQFAKGLSGEARVAAIHALGVMYNFIAALSNPPSSDLEAAAHLAALDKLESTVPARWDFDYYKIDANDELTIFSAAGADASPLTQSKFGRVLEYHAGLRSSWENLMVAVDPNSNTKISSGGTIGPIDSVTRAGLRAAAELQRKKLEEVEQTLGRASSVLMAADFFIRRVTKE